MQKITEFVKEYKSLLENKVAEEKAAKFNELYESKLKELGVKSPIELDEDQSKVFYDYLKSLKEAELSKADVKKMVKDETKDLEKKVEKAEDKAESAEDKATKAKEKAGQGEVTDEKSFREYAEGVLHKAHPDDYDEKIANKVIDGLIAKVEDDNWGEAIGRLTSGLGS